MEILAGVAGLAVGLLAGLLVAGRRAQARAESAADELAALNDELVETQRALDASRAEFAAWKAASEAARASVEQSRIELRNAFAQLGQAALKANSEQFLLLAKEKDEARSAALTEMLKPFKEQLGKLEQGTKELEAKREKAYGSMEEQLRALATATSALDAHSVALRTALRGDARARGRWGEVTLRNVVEAAGLTLHVDFEVQVTMADDLRPDLVVHLPGGEGGIPVDAKAPMDAYLAGLEAEDPDARRGHFAKHARDLRAHVDALAKRDYGRHLATRVEYAVMFVPADPVLAAAFEHDPDLQQRAMEKRVLVATPVTLLALLRTVALYWRQADMARDAQQYWDTAREFHKRVSVFSEHFAKVGAGLSGALGSYNKAVGSFERMVLPQGRKLEELHGPGDSSKLLAEPEAIDETPRALPGAGGGLSAEADAATAG